MYAGNERDWISPSTRNRQSLHHLDPVAGGVLCRDHRHRGPGSPGNPRDFAAIDNIAAIKIGSHFRGHADAHPPELTLLEIGIDIDLGNRHDDHHRLALCHALAKLHLTAGYRTIDGRANDHALKIEPGCLQPGTRRQHGGIAYQAGPSHQGIVGGEFSGCGGAA